MKALTLLSLFVATLAFATPDNSAEKTAQCLEKCKNDPYSLCFTDCLAEVGNVLGAPTGQIAAAYGNNHGCRGTCVVTVGNYSSMFLVDIDYRESYEAAMRAAYATCAGTFLGGSPSCW